MGPEEITKRFAEQAALIEAMRVAFAEGRSGYAQALLVSYLTLPREPDLGYDPRFCPSCWHAKSWNPHAPYPIEPYRPSWFLKPEKDRWICKECPACYIS